MRELQACGFRLAASSWLYESPPAYVTEQPRFLNAAVAGTLGGEGPASPEALLDALKATPFPLSPSSFPSGPVLCSPT